MDAMKRVVGGSEGYVNNNSDDQINININIHNNNNKVMTDEQLEVLRRQISAYATICDQLLLLHRSVTSHQDHLSGMRLGNLYCDPMMTSSGQKISARQRWTPTSTQLQILEGIFGKGNGTPGKQIVKELTNELSQHGPISETNVYNWFQNRRARSKRKQSVSVEGEIESPKEKKSKAEHFGPAEKLDKSSNNATVQSPELSDNVYFFGTQLNKEDSMFGVNQGLRFSDGFDNVALFETVPRMDYLLDKMEVPEGYTHYQLGEEFETSG